MQQTTVIVPYDMGYCFCTVNVNVGVPNTDRDHVVDSTILKHIIEA